MIAAAPALGEPAPERVASAWRALGMVEDPEIPALSLVDLGIVRFVTTGPDGVLQVGISPTYTGCPATEVIRQLVERALEDAAVGPVAVIHVLSPAWSSEWISSEGRRKLAAYGIVPPRDADSSLPVACPRCHSVDTECISRFGSTPCKALHRCRQCLEPFEYFKCI
ncbi:MAG TPA: 1,2-phenylacetyl-CoA epoxidase subunit PaaD [Steroidobacteraceae bacterium]|nr:1,2-phenylacetyl-CoA epoxidase subunit PaaD [Steroidobacteraceae bacterium]